MRDKYVWYFASFLGVIFIKKAFYTENPYDEEASIKLWKSLDSGKISIYIIIYIISIYFR